MQSIARFNLCYFSCPNSEVAHMEYSNKQSLLHGCYQKCKEAYVDAFTKKVGSVCGHVAYSSSDKTFLTFYGYRGYVFCGIYNLNDCKIHFNDHTDFLINLQDYQIDKLESIFRINCSRMVSGNQDKTLNIHKAWENTEPLLNKIIEYDKELSCMSESDKNFVRRNLIYNEHIDFLVSQYENSSVSAKSQTTSNPKAYFEKSLDERLTKAKSNITVRDNSDKNIHPRNIPKK